MNDGYTDLPPGKLAAVVTYLEMRTPAGAPYHNVGLRNPAGRESRPRLVPRSVSRNRWALAMVQPLAHDDDELRAVLHNPDIDIFVLSHNGVDGGLLEFDRRKMPDIEILYFGVTPSLIGKGAGRAMLEHCLPLEWAHRPHRIWLHTCTLDHPGRWSSISRPASCPTSVGWRSPTTLGLLACFRATLRPTCRIL